MLPQVTCIGIATLDTVLSVAPPLPLDGRVLASDGAMAGGGPAATAAAALARLGIPAAFVGRVGSDAAGACIRSSLLAEGVDVSGLQVIEGAASPFSAVLVDPTSAERLIVAHPGTCPPIQLTRKDVRRCHQSRWVHVDQTGWPAVRQLRTVGVETLISVDGGNPIPELDLSLVTLYAPTMAELCAVSGIEDVQAAMAWALDQGPRLVVVTRGAAGSLAMARFELDAAPAAMHLLSAPDGPPNLVAEPAPTIAVRSTLGAGDVFHGALVANLLHGASVREALRAANLVAALSCAALDGRSGIPDQAALAGALDLSARAQ